MKTDTEALRNARIQTRGKLRVMQAFADGHPIEFRSRRGHPDTWRRCYFPTWDWVEFEYQKATLTEDEKRDQLIDDLIGLVHAFGNYANLNPTKIEARIQKVLNAEND